MKRTISMVVALCCATVMLAGCNSDDDETPVVPPPAVTNPNPAPPVIGVAQLDRMGRAVVNTANTAPFFREPTIVLNCPECVREKLEHDTIADDYNVETLPAQWGRFSPIIAANLAIIDSLDGVCGNQVLAGPPGIGRYNRLADILANDQLYVNTNAGKCTQYLAVEGVAAGVPGADPNDCGGRTPTENTADISYSLFAAGVFSLPLPLAPPLLPFLSNGTTSDADGPGVSNTVFPFLDKPL
jgi:hypothetical protein